MSNLKLPHWAQILLGLATVVLAWVMQQESSGALVLPAAAVTAITLVKTLVGVFSSSASPATNIVAGKMAARKLAGIAGATLALCVILGGSLACQACSPATISKVETVSIDSTVCVLNHFSDPPAQIASECGIAAIEDVVKVLEAHRAAMVRELNDAGSVKP